MKVVIDGDQLVYAAGFSCKDEPLSHACQMVKKGLQKILNDTGTEDYSLFIGGKGNFREDVALTQGYKANRTADKPLHYEGIRDYMQDVWGAVQVNGMEVDDMVSILLYADYKETGGSNVILSSPDKDLLNTPGWNYNPRTRKKRFIEPIQAERHFLYQLMTGDTVDNIKGLPHATEDAITNYSCPKACLRGFGPASAKAVAKSELGLIDLEREVYKLYVQWGLSHDMNLGDITAYLEEQAQLLWMVRELDEWDEPVMWNAKVELLESIYEHYKD